MVISDRLADVFSRTGLSNEEILDEIAGYDLNLSVCIDVSGKLAGFYLLRSRNIPKGGKDYRRFRKLLFNIFYLISNCIRNNVTI